MSEMVERVAEAICNQTFRESGPALWKKASPKFREEYLSRARAAITVIREPTRAMRRKGAAMIADDFTAIEAYKAMIDEALK